MVGNAAIMSNFSGNNKNNYINKYRNADFPLFDESSTSARNSLPLPLANILHNMNIIKSFTLISKTRINDERFVKSPMFK